MLLTTNNIPDIVGASAIESLFIKWAFEQATIDNATCELHNGNKAFVGDVTYTLLSDGRIRGKCPIIGLFIAANLS